MERGALNHVSLYFTPKACTPTTVQMTDTTSGVTSLVAANSADSDVIQAMNVLPDALSSLPPCVFSPYAASAAGTVYPGFVGLGIDLSSHPAALDLYVYTLDPNNECVPAQIEGVQIDQLLLDESGTGDGTGEVFY